MREPITVYIGGKDDPWLSEDRGTFPSTTSYAAERYYAKHGKPMAVTTMGHHVITFIENYCVLTNAHFAGKPFKLLPYQKRLLLEAYECIPETRPQFPEFKWRRKHRWAMLGIPKKNGKSELLGALGLYHFADDEEMAPEVICAATSEDQADKVFDPAKYMARNGGLADHLKVSDSAGEINWADDTPGSLARVAAVAASNDGGNTSVFVGDEFHEWVKPKARQVFTTLTGGGVMRRQPLNWMITTAGYDQTSMCFEWYERGVDVRDGQVEDDTFYFCWFEAPEDADFRSPETWRLANPAYGLIMTEEFYSDMLTKRSESEFRRYYCNQWSEAEEIWEASSIWPHLAGDPQFSAERKLFAAIDVGRKHDTSSLVAVQWDPDKSKFQVWQKIWSNPYRVRTEAYNKWDMDVAKIEHECRRLYDEFPEDAAPDPNDDEYMMPGPLFVYDPHFFSRSAETLKGDGLNLHEFPQTDTRMVPVAQRLFQAIKMGLIEHDGDATAKRHMKSVVAQERERGWKMSKIKGTGKAIDFAIALGMAHYVCSLSVDEEDDGPGFTIW